MMGFNAAESNFSAGSRDFEELRDAPVLRDHDVSVIVVVKNGARTLEACLDALLQEPTREVIVVAARESTDNSVQIAQSRPVRLIVSRNSTLALDRQAGVDRSSGRFVLFVDSDHILSPGQIAQLRESMGSFSAGQAGLTCASNSGFWQRAESAYWARYHNKPIGLRTMIGTAPTIFSRNLLASFRFSGDAAGAADDTDFFFRLQQDSNYRFGILPVIVLQVHSGSAMSYFKKFVWYGRGDLTFMMLHPSRTLNHLHHIAVRYMFLRPISSALRGDFACATFCFFYGLGRLAGVVTAAARWVGEALNPTRKTRIQ